MCIGHKLKAGLNKWYTCILYSAYMRDYIGLLKGIVNFLCHCFTVYLNSRLQISSLLIYSQQIMHKIDICCIDCNNNFVVIIVQPCCNMKPICRLLYMYYTYMQTCRHTYIPVHVGCLNSHHLTSSIHCQVGV